MKKFLNLLVCAILVGSVCPSITAKTAVLVTHYGSSDDNTRAKTIDLITSDIRQALPATEVREAYISPVVRRNLAKRGLGCDSPVQALIRLRADGYDSVYVQSTTIIDGVEMAEVRDACNQMRLFFNLLKCSESLCYSPDDCLTLVDILASHPKAKDEAVVFVGHGNLLPSTATYCQLDYMLMAGCHKGYHVSTIEGYPTAETALVELRADDKVKRVTLVPLLLVCGNHTIHDIAGEYAEAIRSAGYQTDVMMRGLAELPAVRALYVSRLKKLMNQ
ncbi:MAG: sirohydrochlorin cobaltochelatase [Muribaculaceae bacterium]|nr:sirohydrochlorin cobaltochelatase [Muribaculaceae bacterium]